MMGGWWVVDGGWREGGGREGENSADLGDEKLHGAWNGLKEPKTTNRFE